MLRRLSLALVSLAAVSAWGQSAISARSGMINHVEGQVLLNGQPVELKFGQFPRVENESILATQDGRAEVLMTPGVFLRLDENSSFKMLSNHLSDTALEVVSGSAILEVDEMLKDNAITLHFKNGTISLAKRGLYRFDTELSRMRVYDGQADVLVDEKTTTVRKGRQVVLGEALVASNFDTNDTDPFYRWASRRAEYISAANISSARTAGASSGSGLVSSSYGGPCANYGGLYPNYGSMYSGCGYGAWAWNPYFGMYTYVPGFGYGYSPFGWDFFSPYTVGYAYAPYLYGGTTYGGPTSRLPAVGRVTPPTESNVGRTALTAARSTPPSASPAASASSASSSSNGPRLGGSGGSGPSVSSGGAGMSRGGSAGGGRR